MNKGKFFEQSKKSVAEKCEATLEFKESTIKWLKKAKGNYKNLSGVDKLVVDKLIEYIEYKDGRVEELTYLFGSSYFMHCRVKFENESEVVDLFFGKFSFSEESIYSWILPVSAIRFEDPGNAKYTKPSGNVKRLKILRKDQYMIVDGKIKFLATEAIELTRKLIYQDHFSNRKSSFMLPEIVAQMEKAQDEVIRAHHIGLLVILGSAGSGKTTLALHRIAYLLQSPDLDARCVIKIGESEEEKDLYEQAKLEALKSNNENLKYAKNVFTVLKKFYNLYFTKEQQEIF